MPPKFGTSGLRGLVTELTPDLVGAHVAAFLRACPVGTGLFVGCDLRPSSPDIAGMVAEAARAAGIQVTDCGAVPTPARPCRCSPTTTGPSTGSWSKAPPR